jgi:hypothetical protein
MSDTFTGFIHGWGAKTTRFEIPLASHVNVSTPLQQPQERTEEQTNTKIPIFCHGAADCAFISPTNSHLDERIVCHHRYKEPGLLDFCFNLNINQERKGLLLYVSSSKSIVVYSDSNYSLWCFGINIIRDSFNREQYHNTVDKADKINATINNASLTSKADPNPDNDLNKNQRVDTSEASIAPELVEVTIKRKYSPLILPAVKNKDEINEIDDQKGVTLNTAKAGSGLELEGAVAAAEAEGAMEVVEAVEETVDRKSSTFVDNVTDLVVKPTDVINDNDQFDEPIRPAEAGLGLGSGLGLGLGLEVAAVETKEVEEGALKKSNSKGISGIYQDLNHTLISSNIIVRQIAAGDSHCLVLTDSNELYSYGKLGLGLGLELVIRDMRGKVLK